MADLKISELTNLTAADPVSDMLPIVDVSATPPASGSTKRISINNILSSSPTASGALTVTGLVTAGSATITGAATVGTTLGVTGVSTFAAGTAALPALTTTGDTNTGIFFPAADTFAVTTGGTERYRVDSTGLGIGVAPNLGLNVLKTSDLSFTNLPTNVGFADSTAMAAGVGGGIAFSGRYGATADTTAYGIISGVKENGTAANFAGALVFGTRDAGGNVNIERLRINSTGNIVMKNASTGIDFSINSNAGGATSEILNDYEEGTFTPTVVGTTTAGVGAYTSQVGRYTKIGNLVSVQVYLNWSEHTGTGNLRFGGLPFTISSDTSYFSAVTIGYTTISLTASNVLTAYGDTNTTNIEAQQYPVGGGSTANVPIDTAAIVMYALTYKV
jgi:hypothetical protein